MTSFTNIFNTNNGCVNDNNYTNHSFEVRKTMNPKRVKISAIRESVISCKNADNSSSESVNYILDKAGTASVSVVS